MQRELLFVGFQANKYFPYMLACRSCVLAALSRSELGHEIPTSPRPSQDAHDGPMVHPYELQARGSARSHANGWRVCRGMLEHAPTLTSSIARRGASVSGCSAAKWTTVKDDEERS